MAAHHHRIGAKVTCRRLQLHATVLETHVSHRVQRLDMGQGDGELPIEIVVGEDEKVPFPVSEPIETYVSHRIENHWDGSHHWVADHELAAGHDMEARAV